MKIQREFPKKHFRVVTEKEALHLEKGIPCPLCEAGIPVIKKIWVSLNERQTIGLYATLKSEEE